LIEPEDFLFEAARLHGKEIGLGQDETDADWKDHFQVSGKMVPVDESPARRASIIDFWETPDRF
jgi:hypothetical protein